MFVRAFSAAMLLAATAQAQTVSPNDQQWLMHPSAIGGSASTFQPAPDKSKNQAAKGKQAKPGSVSISSELSSGTTTSHHAPALRQPAEAAQKKPFDDRLPLGPLSLGLQAEADPRSDSLVTPTPNGINQFKKERATPYVGVSIIDIKR